jgi:hypothetical protein
VVFAAGTVTSLPYPSTDPEWPMQVNVELERGAGWLHEGIPLDRLNDGHRDLNVSIRRRSHIELTEAEYDNAVALLPPI